MKRPVPDSSLDESTEKSSGKDSISSGETLLRAQGHELTREQFPPPLAQGRYQIAEGGLLGKGGQATVWRAYDKVLRREVALKKLHGPLLDDPTAVSSFLREARLTALLDHPGIVA